MALKDNYITITQAAKQLGVTRQTISRWIVKGYVLGEKIGRETLIKKRDLQKYHRLKLSEAAADAILAMYLSEVEDYCREKGYISEPGHMEFAEEGEVNIELTSQNKDEITNRLKPKIEALLKQLSRQSIIIGKPTKKKGGR